MSNAIILSHSGKGKAKFTTRHKMRTLDIYGLEYYKRDSGYYSASHAIKNYGLPGEQKIVFGIEWGSFSESQILSYLGIHSSELWEKKVIFRVAKKATKKKDAELFAQNELSFTQACFKR